MKNNSMNDPKKDAHITFNVHYKNYVYSVLTLEKLNSEMRWVKRNRRKVERVTAAYYAKNGDGLFDFEKVFEQDI